MKKWKTLISVIILSLTIVMLFYHNDKFDKEIQETISSLRSHGSNFSIIIYTDIHYDPKLEEPSPLRDTMDCMKIISEKVHIDALWNLGDFINGNDTTKGEAIEQIKTVINEQKSTGLTYHNIMGNHDNNIRSTWNNESLQETEILSVKELYDLMINTNTSQKEQHNDNRLTDYYVDYPTVRVICLSAEYTSFVKETVEWLRNIALQTEKEVLILSHIPTRSEWGFRNDVEHGDTIEEVITEFVTSGGTVICYIHGHDHGDMINDTGLWKEVAIGCARFQKPTSNGTKGMIFWDRNEKDETKVLFDIICIDQNEREVHFIRFGAGVDRVIEY